MFAEFKLVKFCLGAQPVTKRLLFKSILLSTLNVKLNRLHSVHTQLKMGTYMYLYIQLKFDCDGPRRLNDYYSEHHRKGSIKPHDLVRSLTVDFFKNSFYLVYKYNMMSSSFCDVTLRQGREKIVISLVNYPTPISTISPQQTSFTDVIG